MKVKLTIELELPDDVPELTEQGRNGLSQLLFDSYVNYVTCKHWEDARHWCAKGKVGSDNEDLSAKLIYQYHNTWGHICRDAKWDFEEVK
jgi:hypothetical protein